MVHIPPASTNVPRVISWSNFATATRSLPFVAKHKAHVEKTNKDQRARGGKRRGTPIERSSETPTHGHGGEADARRTTERTSAAASPEQRESILEKGGEERGEIGQTGVRVQVAQVAPSAEIRVAHGGRGASSPSGSRHHILLGILVPPLAHIVLRPDRPGPYRALLHRLSTRDRRPP